MLSAWARSWGARQRECCPVPACEYVCVVSGERVRGSSENKALCLRSGVPGLYIFLMAATAGRVRMACRGLQCMGHCVMRK